MSARAERDLSSDQWKYLQRPMRGKSWATRGPNVQRLVGENPCAKRIAEGSRGIHGEHSSVARKLAYSPRGSREGDFSHWKYKGLGKGVSQARTLEAGGKWSLGPKRCSRLQRKADSDPGPRGQREGPLPCPGTTEGGICCQSPGSWDMNFSGEQASSPSPSNCTSPGLPLAPSGSGG